LLAALSLLAPAASNEAGLTPRDASTERSLALGLEVGVLPPLMSAIAGGLGVSGQTGKDRWRLRLVGAHLRYPDALIGNDAFRQQEATVAALLIDRFLFPGFRGPWIGAGAELWSSSIGQQTGPARAGWTDAVLTVGVGYVWKFWRDLYLNPWAAAHWTTSSHAIALYGSTFMPRRLSAEVSPKVGWNFWL
jgi:hypothetical protein